MSHVSTPNNIVDESTDELHETEQANIQEELSEDMEVMGPGQILSDARKKLGYSQTEVAQKLNFRATLVNEIENEVFDNSLPETFNRGYLRNYAKLVNVSQTDVMASYEQLNIAKAQASELQSFSKGTEKIAENNRIMWISYFILAVLIGSTVVWWLQNNNQQSQSTNDGVDLITPTADEISKPDAEIQVKYAEIVSKLATPAANIDIENSSKELTRSNEQPNNEQSELATPKVDNTAAQNNEKTTSPESLINDQASDSSQTNVPEVVLTDITFTFSGDCWVNISDATGERIAWGVKKLGYVMKISGQAPFNVTLGKPELVTINYADENIDMSQFNAGNIAKFTLPISN